MVGALFSAVADGIAAGDVPSAGEAGAPDFDRIRDEFAFIDDDVAVLKCFLLWATLVGSISLEVFGQYGADTLTNPVDVFDGQLGCSSPRWKHQTRTRSSQHDRPAISSTRCLTRHLSRSPGSPTTSTPPRPR